MGKLLNYVQYFGSNIEGVAESWVEAEISWVELGGGGWSWVEVDARFSNTRYYIYIAAFWEPWNSQNSLFEHFQTYSRIFNQIQPCSGILRNIRAYWGIFKHYWGIWSHNQEYSELCVTPDPCIYNRDISTTLAYLESEAPSKACRICKMIMPCIYSGSWHSQNSLFKHFQRHLGILMHTQPHSHVLNLGKGGGLHCLFFKSKSVLNLERKALIVPNFGLNVPFKKCRLTLTLWRLQE